MRLRHVERGDRLPIRLLYGVIRAVSGYRAPDVVRTLKYRQHLFGQPHSAHTQVVLRGQYAIESRNFYTTSSCGVCGKASIDSVKVHSHHDVSADPMTIRAATLSTLPDKLRQAQRGFARTGGSHAAGVFTGSISGFSILATRTQGLRGPPGWIVRRREPQWSRSTT